MRDYSNLLTPFQERRERKRIEQPRPLVIRECICRNHGAPDDAGWISVDPNCLRHGRHLPHSTRPPSVAEKEATALREAARKADMLRKAKRARERAEKKQQMKRR